MQQITIELLQDVDAIHLKRLLYFLVKSNGFSLTTLILLYSENAWGLCIL